MNPARIDRTITRIAFQIYEDTHGSDQLVIFGVSDRGYRLATILAAKLSHIYHTQIRAFRIPLAGTSGNGADQNNPGHSPDSDTSSLKKNQSEHPEKFPTVLNKKVVIMDDVMYSGRTMYQALQIVTDKEKPEEIKLAALIDRGHRRYPINIHYLGLYSPTKLKEHVRCRFKKNGDPDGVWLQA